MENQSEQLQTPQQPGIVVASESPRKQNIWAIVLGGMLLMILAVGGIYIYSLTNNKSLNQNTNQVSQISPTAIPFPSIDETANWEIYTGSTFTFKYPSSWINGKNEIYNPTSATKGGNGTGNETIYTQQLSFTVTPSVQTAKMYVDDIQKSEQNPAGNASLAQAFTRQQITVNGQAAEVYTIGGEGTAGAYTVFSNGKSLVQFGPVKGNLSDIAILNQIISTFKFTDKTQATDTSSWKTYSGDSFSFQYPQDFGIAPVQSSDGKTSYTDLIIAPKATTDQINELTKQGSGMGSPKKDTIVLSTIPPLADRYISDSTKIVSASTVTISNKQAKRYVISYKVALPGVSTGDVFTDTVFASSGKTYTVELLDQQRIKEYEHLLSTLKFTN